MAYWNNLDLRKKQLIQGLGSGINTFNEPLFINDNELTDSVNMCSDAYPSLEVRPDRALIVSGPSSTNPFKVLGIRNSTTKTAATSDIKTQVHILVGTSSAASWYYLSSILASSWSIISSTMQAYKPGRFVEFNTQTAKYTILAYSNSTQYNSYWDGATYSTFASTASPRSNLLTSHRYRLYGIDNDMRTLRYSAQGDITDWTTAQDAGWIDLTDLSGTPSAITTFNDHVIIWSDKNMYELYGSSVDNFELVNVSKDIGCVGVNAFTECDGKLYWLDYNGIFMYTGGIPRRVSHKVKKYIDNINWSYRHLICAGSIKGKIYFCVPYGASQTENNKIIVLDLKNIDSGLIISNIEGDSSFDGNWNGFIDIDGILLGYQSTSHKIWQMASTSKTGYDGANAVNYAIETKPLHDIGFNINTNITDIVLSHEGTSTATMNIAYWDNKNSTNNSTTFVTMTASTELSGINIKRSRLLPTSTQLQNADIFKFKISGAGYKKFHGLHINMASYGNMS